MFSNRMAHHCLATFNDVKFGKCVKAEFFDMTSDAED